MRIKTFNKKLIWLNEKDYKQILERFDYHKYFEDIDNEIKTDIECPLCNKYEKVCNNCQLHIFKAHSGLGSICGCERLMLEILKVNNTEFFITWDEVGYYDNDGWSTRKESEKQLDKLTKFLKTFEQISYKDFRRLKK